MFRRPGARDRLEVVGRAGVAGDRAVRLRIVRPAVADREGVAARDPRLVRHRVLARGVAEVEVLTLVGSLGGGVRGPPATDAGRVRRTVPPLGEVTVMTRGPGAAHRVLVVGGKGQADPTVVV